MAISTVGILLAKNQAIHVIEAVSPKEPFAIMTMAALFQYLGQHRGNPDLQTKVVKLNNAADSVIADAACKLYALVYKKPAASATAAFLQASDHASAVQAEEEFTEEITATDNNVRVFLWPRGKDYGTGITIISATTAAGGTRSADADCGTLMAIIGAP